MMLKKRIEALEQKRSSKKLLFPDFLLNGLPDHLSEFHKSGLMAKYCTLSEAWQAVRTNRIFELIKQKYHESIAE